MNPATKPTQPRLLLGPGPCNVSARVLEAIARPLLGHLDPAFLSVLERVKRNLRTVFGTDNDVTFPVSGTGSAGMELLLSNFVEPGSKVVVGVNGVFGKRIAHLSQRLGAEVVTVDAAWGKPIDSEEFQRAITTHQPAVAAIVNGETSTGVYQPMEQIGATCQDAGALLMMDCVTSLGAMPVHVDEWGVDLAFSGTQKCLGCPPGLAPITISDRALEVFHKRKRPVPSFYFDLRAVLSYIDGSQGRSYHHTAPVSMIFALDAALGEVLDEGLASRLARHRAASEQLVASLAPLGFEPLVESNHRLFPLTTLRLPSMLKDAEARSQLLEGFGIEVGGGLGVLAGAVWRVGLMAGNATPQSVERLTAAVQTLLPR